MDFNFEEFTLMPGSRRADAIRVSLNNRGAFSMNQLAFEALNSAKKVTLLFDKEKGVIAIRPALAEVKHALEIKKQGKANSYLIRALTFCNYYDIKAKQTIVFDDVMEHNGMLLLDLHKATPVAPRQPRTKNVAKPTEQKQPPLIQPEPEREERITTQVETPVIETSNAFSWKQ